jgi:co-chaperonin GroES (HSP10)
MLNHGLRLVGDRVLVAPDVDAHAPEQLASGVHVARSLAAAVTGTDPTTSVTRGTVVAVGTRRHPRAGDAQARAVRAQSSDPALACLLRQLVAVEPWCAVGDDVLFPHDAGQQLTLDEGPYVLLAGTDILAIVDPPEWKDLIHG